MPKLILPADRWWAGPEEDEPPAALLPCWNDWACASSIMLVTSELQDLKAMNRKWRALLKDLQAEPKGTHGVTVLNRGA